MPLVNMKDLLDHAYRHNYAVGAFEVINLEFLQGVMAAAERCRAPVIVGLGRPQQETVDFDLLAAAVMHAAQRTSVPVVIHMHHCADIQSAVHAVKAGCNGVMVDASHRDLGDNMDITGRVVAMAREYGVPVEGKLGYAADEQGDGAEADPGRVAYTAVAEARGYVDRTGVDFLSVSVVTAAGGPKARPKLNWQRLKQINEVLGVPLAIGGDPALSHSHYARLISYGVAKINYYAGLAQVAHEQVRSSLKTNAKGGYGAVMGAARAAVEQETERCLRLWGAAGRAAEVLEQCKPWVSRDDAANQAQHLDEIGVDALIGEPAYSGPDPRQAHGLLRQFGARR